MIDLSHLYKTETIDFGGFRVTVREITNGEIIDMQKSLIGEITMSKDKRSMDKQLESIRLSPPEFAAKKAVLGIVSWTLVDANGDTVPIGLEAWRALPRAISEKIEQAIERLNPEMDADFQD